MAQKNFMETRNQNRNISDVQANAYIVAATNNKEDFEDAKQLFKETLQKALQQAPDDRTKLQIYQDAVKGFLMQLGSKGPEDRVFKEITKQIVSAFDSLEREVQSKKAYLAYQMPLTWILVGLTGLAWLLPILFKFFGI